MINIFHRIGIYVKRPERFSLLFQQPDVITSSLDEVSANEKPIVRQIRKLPKQIAKLMEMLPQQEACAQIGFYELICFMPADYFLVCYSSILYFAFPDEVSISIR